jgi:hypothetical protein
VESPRVQHVIETQALKGLLDPTTYVGFAPEVVACVLAEARTSGWMQEEPGREPVDTGRGPTPTFGSQMFVPKPSWAGVSGHSHTTPIAIGYPHGSFRR